MEFGVNILGIIPLRKEPKDQSEMVSQILFGQHFKILETKPSWVRIQLADDDYEGWICAKQYDEITYEDYDNFNLNNFPKACDKIGYLEDINTGELTPIPTGSTLPYFHQGTVRVRQKKFKFKGALASDNIKDIGIYAHYFLNSPYLWGGKSILGIDCSGFTQLVFSLSGIQIPRDAYQQEKIGESVDFVDIKPFDLVFFINDKNRVHHVGIALENSQIIHASGQVRIDSLTNEGIIHSLSNELTHRLHSIKRILE